MHYIFTIFVQQAEFMNLQTGFAYISFGVVLFVWEFLPTFIVVVFFRVQRPHIGDEVKIYENMSLMCRSEYL